MPVKITEWLLTTAAWQMRTSTQKPGSAFQQGQTSEVIEIKVKSFEKKILLNVKK